MKPMEGCSLFGAYRACIGIQDAVILVHSIVGCSFGTMAFHQARVPEDVRQASTVFYEQEAVYGGTESLIKALRNADELYRKVQLFIVLSGCVPNMVGDDIEAAIQRAGLTRPVVHIAVPGTAGDEQSGYEAAMLLLARYMKPQTVQAGQINLLGLSADDFLLAGDLVALRQLLGRQIRIRTVLGSGNFADWCGAPAASLNVVFSQGLAAAQYMQRQFGTPYIAVSYPYGVHGGAVFLEQLAAVLPGVDYENAIARIQRQVQPVLSRMSFYLRLLYALPAAILGDGVRSEGLRCFLTDELGMDIVACHVGGRGDLDETYQTMERLAVPLVFGSSFDRGWCEAHQAALVRLFYPVFDEVVFSRRSFLGVNGFYTLLETIVNVLQRQSLSRRRLYAGVELPAVQKKEASAHV